MAQNGIALKDGKKTWRKCSPDLSAFLEIRYAKIKCESECFIVYFCIWLFIDEKPGIKSNSKCRKKKGNNQP